MAIMSELDHEIYRSKSSEIFYRQIVEDNIDTNDLRKFLLANSVWDDLIYKNHGFKDKEEYKRFEFRLDSLRQTSGLDNQCRPIGTDKQPYPYRMKNGIPIEKIKL